MSTQPRTEFAQALKALSSDLGLDVSVILSTINSALEAAYRRDLKERGIDIDENIIISATIDPITGESKIFSHTEGLEDQKKDVTPPGFGRIAAQTAKQVIHQKIREAQKQNLLEEYQDRIGNLISGIVIRFEGSGVRVDIGKTEAIVPQDERIKEERYSPNQRLTFLLKDIVDTPQGKQIILSRSDPLFVEKLFAREVPEIASGSVKITNIARKPGFRTKIIVSSQTPGVDPVGSCVGQKGVRVQAVTNELGEKIDIIPASDSIEEIVKSALSPVEVKQIVINKEDQTAVITVSEEDLAQSIGKEGLNVELTKTLTGLKFIDIVSEKKDQEKKVEVEETKPISQ